MTTQAFQGTLYGGRFARRPRSGKARGGSPCTDAFRTGRAVHNPIDATFEFRDGLIADHRDDFDLYAWARQALGPVGLVLGWSPPVQGKIRGEARKGLEEFMAGVTAAASTE